MSYYNNYNEGTLASNGEVTRGTAGIPGKDDDRKLFVGGLSRLTTDKELRDYFGKFGDIESVTVKVDPYTGQSRGFAFIVFSDAKSIETLLASGDHYINKRKVDPKKVSKKPQHGKIFVGGLTPEMTDADIRNYFSQFGPVVEIQSPFDKLKNQRKGFCFITFDSKDVVYKLLKTPKQVINGKAVDVKKVKTNPENMWTGNNRFYSTMPWLAVNSRYSNHYGGYSDDYSYSYDGYADYGDYGYYQPFSGVANNYGGVRPKPSGGNNTSGAGGSGAPGSGSGGTGNSGAVRQFQRHQPY